MDKTESGVINEKGLFSLDKACLFNYFPGPVRQATEAFIPGYK